MYICSICLTITIAVLDNNDNKAGRLLRAGASPPGPEATSETAAKQQSEIFGRAKKVAEDGRACKMLWILTSALIYLQKENKQLKSSLLSSRLSSCAVAGSGANNNDNNDNNNNNNSNISI